ncbi:NAD(P)-binding Rossmann-like domain-containing protein [Acinetobacter marinus]|uniref:NAD(P)-binding Rossmann-like domain-containing protein n=1 Tax=Acinetobacter marinus TaxID=281375 RepID=A0A1G6MXU5_9GAMM|nr:NAD(P)-binding Rossmann-like domain-containing protein [Acinetobacter marinus]
MKANYDVVIIGAGISGIDMACQLSMYHPNKRYIILERRQDLGGTWDLFKYPGIRSDSDMATFGFKFRPWKKSKVLAEATEIKDYLKETAEEYGVLEHIRYGTEVSQLDFDSQSSCWTISIKDVHTEQSEKFSVNLWCHVQVITTMTQVISQNLKVWKIIKAPLSIRNFGLKI